jgi:ATP-binding cassette subfamily B protein RaxB
MMILDHYDIPSTTDEIERHVRLTARGSTMLSLQEMAELKGLTATGWRLSVEELASRPLPALLFVHRDHFVVADSVCGGQVFLRDPAIGRIRMPERKLMHIWNGETLLFGRQ